MDNKKNNTGQVVFGGLLWRFAEKFGAQSVTLIVTIVLSRILDPQVYGTIALVTVFTAIVEVFVDSGLGTALVQKKDADDIDFSSVFYINIVLCTVLYAFMFFIAPVISNFYNMPKLTVLIRVLSLTILISGLKNIQQAYVSRHMLFKKFFFSTLAGTIGAAVIGVAMALLGFGVWALIAQYLFNKITDTIVLWITVKWRPKRCFSWKRVKKLYSFGWKILAANVINTLYNQLRGLVIGKFYSASDLAYFNKAEQLPSLLIMNINSTIDSVLLPAMSNEQENKERVRNLTRRSVSIGTYIIAPVMIGFAASARSLIGLVFTDKWLPVVELLQIVCVAYMFQPIQSANMNAIKALGQSGVYLKLDILKKIIGIISIVISVFFGVKAITYSLLVIAIVFQFVNTLPNKKLLDYGYIDQLKDIIPSIVVALIMGGIVYCVEFLKLNYVFTLMIQIPLGVMIYILLSKLFKLESFEYLLSIVKSFKNKKKEKKSEEI